LIVLKLEEAGHIMSFESAKPPHKPPQPTQNRSTEPLVPSSPALLARSLLFSAVFYANMIILMIIGLPMIALPYRFFHGILRTYARTSLWLLRVLCGISVEWRGRERLPDGACLVACKHQSVWETFALFMILPDPTYVLKRELMWIPLFGWLARKSGMIPIDRGTRVTSLAAMRSRARAEIGRGRQIVIFPEGTRRPPGAEPRYLPGVALLYGELGLPCVPVALNSGLFWPRRSLLRFPGTVLVEVLDPIPAGLDRRTFMKRLQGPLEEATARLVAEGEDAQTK
jgi:1-acyl-sn-glycerol-3-phosphate acyltransferase